MRWRLLTFIKGATRRPVSQPKKSCKSTKSDELKKVPGSAGFIDEGQRVKKASGSDDGKKIATKAGKKVKKTLQPTKAPKSPEFVDTGSEDSDDKKEPAEFVYTDQSTLLLLTAVKHRQKTPKKKKTVEEPQKKNVSRINVQRTDQASKIDPCRSYTHILTSGARPCRLKASHETGKFCKYHKRQA